MEGVRRLALGSLLSADPSVGLWPLSKSVVFLSASVSRAIEPKCLINFYRTSFVFKLQKKEKVTTSVSGSNIRRPPSWPVEWISSHRERGNWTGVMDYRSIVPLWMLFTLLMEAACQSRSSGIHYFQDDMAINIYIYIYILYLYLRMVVG